MGVSGEEACGSEIAQTQGRRVAKEAGLSQGSEPVAATGARGTESVFLLLIPTGMEAACSARR